MDTARTQPDRAINRYRSEFPAGVTCLEDDLEAPLAIHRVPVRHRVNVRTTNLAERSFVKELRRTKVIPRLLDEKSAMKLMLPPRSAAPNAGRRSRSVTWNATGSSSCARNSESTRRPTRNEIKTTEATIAA